MSDAMRLKLEEAMRCEKRVKLFFQYPSRDKAIIKSGIIKEIYSDGFVIKERYDGIVTYAYTFLVEIQEVGV